MYKASIKQKLREAQKSFKYFTWKNDCTRRSIPCHQCTMSNHTRENFQRLATPATAKMKIRCIRI